MMYGREENLSSLKQCIIDEGGEGVILQQSLSVYTGGRVATLLKLKVYPSDT